MQFTMTHYDHAHRRDLELDIDFEADAPTPGYYGSPDRSEPAEGGGVTDLTLCVTGVILYSPAWKVEHRLSVADGTLSAAAAAALAREFEIRLEHEAMLRAEIDGACLKHAEAMLTP